MPFDSKNILQFYGLYGIICTKKENVSKQLKVNRLIENLGKGAWL